MPRLAPARPCRPGAPATVVAEALPIAAGTPIAAAGPAGALARAARAVARCAGRAIAAVAIAACGGPAAPAGPIPDLTAPTPRGAAIADRAAPAPGGTGGGAAGCRASVAWRDGAFAVTGLPCVASDGSAVIFARSDERPRFPDLAIVAVTRADTVARSAIVMEAHERAELVDPAGAPTAQLTARIAEANALLAELGPAAVPLPAFAATPAGTFTGQGLELAWTERGRLTLSRDGRFEHSGDYRRWLEQLTACAPPSYLASVWGDAARGLLLVRIAYRGSGGCTALPEQHVVAWTPAPS
jgi:hypothetical protein